MKDPHSNYCTVHGCSQCENKTQVPCAKTKCPCRFWWDCLRVKEHDVELCTVCTFLAAECKHPLCKDDTKHIEHRCQYRCRTRGTTQECDHAKELGGYCHPHRCPRCKTQVRTKDMPCYACMCKIDNQYVYCNLKQSCTTHNHGCKNMRRVDSGPKGESGLCSSCVIICSVDECESDHRICKHCCVEENCSERKAYDTDYCTVHLCSTCKRPHEANPELFDDYKYVNSVSETKRSPFWRPSDSDEIEPENVMCVKCKLTYHPPLMDEESDEDEGFGIGLIF